MERFFKLKENFTGMNSIQRSSLRVMLCGTSILALAIGIRLSFGLFLQPMSQTLGWGRETFAFAIALQNIVWGLTQPLMGMLADKYGTRKVLQSWVVPDVSNRVSPYLEFDRGTFDRGQPQCHLIRGGAGCRGTGSE